MGTAYQLYKENDSFELTISEMSNKLSLCFDSGQLFQIFNSDEMSPEDMVKIMLEGLTVCSYWMDTDELKKLIEDHVDKKIY